jgi:hypothetical protein
VCRTIGHWWFVPSIENNLESETLLFVFLVLYYYMIYLLCLIIESRTKLCIIENDVFRKSSSSVHYT